MTLGDLTERQQEILRWLDDETWETPRAVGGRDGSHHAQTLRQLVAKGLAETRKLHAIYCPNGLTERSTWNAELHRWVRTTGHPPYEGCRCKGSRRYRRTPAGRDLVRTATPATAVAAPRRRRASSR